MKRFALVFLIAVFSIFLVFFVYKIFFVGAGISNDTIRGNNNGNNGVQVGDDGNGGQTTTPVDNSDSDNGVGDTGVITGERMNKIIDGRTKGANLSFDGNKIVYYDNQKFYSVSLSGELKEEIGAAPFIKTVDFKWSNDKKQVLVQDDQNFFVYQLSDNSVRPITDSIDVITWSNKIESIAYKKYDADSGKRILYHSGLALGDKKVLTDEIVHKDVGLVTRFKSDEVCMFPASDNNIKGKFECFDYEGDKIRVAHEGAYGADYLWSPNGRRLLISYLQEQGDNRLNIGAMNARGGEMKGVFFPATVKKCVWSSDNRHVYCAMMSGFPSQALLPNDWQEEKFPYKDASFWRIDTEMGDKDRIIQIEEMTAEVDAIDLFLDKSEKYLFFTDRISGGVFRIEIDKSEFDPVE